MNILLVNDDGINSPYLALLCRAAAARGHRVTVCAPSTQQSAKAHSFTVFAPVTVHPRAMEGACAAWAVDGTPVDCTRLGLMALCEDGIDLVLSGINDGFNAGLATFVSGTVGAAREAAFLGKPAMAVSMQVGTPPETAAFFADWAVALGERLVTFPVPEQAVCNVNVPAVPMYRLQPPVMCPISRVAWSDSYERRESPRGGTYFWLMPENFDTLPTPGSDLDHLKQGHITCTLLTPEECRQEEYAGLLDM
ncbi:MAG: 5'/3'-nucleotidase SurE [Aristaeellaceae bacterium]